MTRPLPPAIEKMLADVPCHGGGVHQWLFDTARQLHAYLPAVEIIGVLEECVAHCGRVIPRKEIKDAVKNSVSFDLQPGAKTSARQGASKWPVVNQELRNAIIAKRHGLAELWDLSKPRIDDNAVRTEEIIDRIFPDNPLLCCGESSYQFDTKPREAWRSRLSTLSFIVPSPMSSVTGLTKDGRTSKHTLDNTGPRRFLICEFDSGTTDEHAALLLHLATFAPLVCAVHSGGKSLHGWFYVHGQPDAKVEKFFRYAVSLGADRATWTRCQFVRMPDGTRDDGNRQTVFYLNFKPLEAAR